MVFSEGIQIVARWDSQSAPGLEAVFHHSETGEVLAPQVRRVRELETELIWNLDRLPSGRYRFFMVNRDFEGEFADWAGYSWLDFAMVLVSSPEGDYRIQPRSGTGTVWWVFEALGETQEVHISNQILPRTGSFFGYVRDASTGLPIRDMVLEFWTSDGQRRLARDRSSSNGLYIIFLPPGNYRLKAERAGYISHEEPVELEAWPRRVDLVLSRPLPENTWRFALTWANFPADLDLEASGSEADRERLIRDQRTAQAFGLETLTFEGPPTAPLRLWVRPGEAVSRTWFAYSRARLRVFFQNELRRTFEIPTNVGNLEWSPLEIDESGNLVVTGL